MTVIATDVPTVPVGADRLLVGRERELGELRAALADAVAGAAPSCW